MKRNTWESIRLMLWAWEMGSGTTLPEGLREVLEKAEEPDPLAARLLDYMKSRELNASRVAKDLGCSDQTLRNILTGKTSPSGRVTKAIGGYLAARGQEAPGTE